VNPGAPDPGTLPLADASPVASLGGRPGPRAALGGRPGPRAGLWRYADVIPVDPEIAQRLTLGEGDTPLIAAGDGELAGVFVKLEFVSPTGSFKDRGAVVLVAALAERGAQALIADSSGNAGSAIAAYAARAGLPCRVFVPATTTAAKQAQIRAFGATLVSVAGDRVATAQAALAAVGAGEAAYASHVYDPHFLQGTKTFAYEVWEQLGRAPDTVIIPAGNGTLLLGAAIGFAELEAAGLIDRRPALVAVQAERCAPLAAAWQAGADGPVPVKVTETAAEGIAIPAPARGAEMLAAVRHSGGTIVAVPEDEIGPARAWLAARGLLVEPTAAVPWAGLLALRRRGFSPGTVVVPLCGTGLKAAV
jgi:threonine synthase